MTTKTKATHTPGNWEIGCDTYDQQIGMIHSAGQPVAFVKPGDYQLADEQLIAAAPDLLAACKYAFATLHSKRFDTAAYDSHCTALERAIVKAEGRV